MSQFNFLRSEKTDGVARVTLARPKHNVLNLEMMKELTALLAELESDVDLKCVVIVGEGKSWCAGVEVGDHKPELAPEMIAVFDKMLAKLSDLEVPTIAAVHGACLGGGMELAIACDIIITSSKALLGQPEIKLGFFPPYAAIRLPELVGPARAIEICTSGKTYTAQDCLNMGLVSQMVDEAQFDAAVNSMVKEIAYNSPLIIRMNKRIIKATKGLPIREAAAKANDYFLNSLMKTDDTLEGIKSFEEKRKPVWQNK